MLPELSLASVTSLDSLALQPVIKKVIWWVHEDPALYPADTAVMEIMTEAAAVVFNSPTVKQQWEDYIEKVSSIMSNVLCALTESSDIQRTPYSSSVGALELSKAAHCGCETNVFFQIA